MKTQTSKTTTCLVILITALCFCAALITDTHVYAQSARSNKVGDDVRQKATHVSQIDVLVQSVGSWSSALDSTIAGNGGSVKHSYKNFNVRAITLPSAAIDALANRSDIAFVSLDADFASLGHVSLTSGADAASTMSGNTSSPYDGTGIGIAILDSGIAPTHAAFLDKNGNSRIKANVDFTGEGRTDDPFGHGTHVASIAAGNGNISASAYRGIAPNANLVNLRVLNSKGQGTTSGLLNALDWVMTNKTTYNIRVVNMSLGAPAINTYTNDPVCQAVRRLVDAGVVVVAAAGNDGKDSAGQKIYGAIHSPGNEPSAITVGAANTLGTDARNDDAVTTYSSRGPTRSFYTDISGTKHYDNLIKPDLVAPGNKIIDAQANGNYLVTTYPNLDADVSASPNKDQMYLSGTSMASPVVAGAAALLLQANPNLTPNMVRMSLEYTAQQLPTFNTLEQGAGEVNIEGAMRLAKLIRTDLSSTTAVGDPLLCATCAAPTTQTTIAGLTFTWAQGLVMDQTFGYGSNLMLKYQKVYGLGVLVGDGTMLSNGVLVSDGVLMSDGVLVGDNILTSNGVLMSDGVPFQSCGVLLGDGVLMSDGVLVGDGVLMGDATLMSNGVLVADTTQAQSVLTSGDNTAAMVNIKDITKSEPGGLAAVATQTQVNLTWKDKSVDETGFYIERCQGAGCANFAQIGQAAANATTFSNTGLAANTTYIYRVRAFNKTDFSPYSTTLTVTTPPITPAAPTTMSATAISSSQINLAWADNSTNETGFSIERSIDGVTFAQVGTVGANVKTFGVTGLLRSTKYYFRVRAYNTGGNSAYSNSSYATTGK